MDTLKKCSKCGNDFPATTEYFHKRIDKRRPNSKGFRAECKVCQKVYSKAIPKETKAKYTRTFYEKHKTKRLEENKEYRESHPTYWQEYYQKNKPAFKKYYKKYHKKNFYKGKKRERV